LHGARAVAELTDLASCDVVLTSLPDDDALAAVALGAGGLCTKSSTKGELFVQNIDFLCRRSEAAGPANLIF
jgi:3-hydroxyisobutyrate dehydrogenase-like beta-hydroxyacid dehydrogenase